MKDPIKVIHKIKNNNRKIIYKVYIFVGPFIDEIILNTLNKIRELDFITTLIELEKNNYLLLENYYGKFWYKYFFLSYHIHHQIDLIKTKFDTIQKSLISKYGNDWYNEHINKPIIKINKDSFVAKYNKYLTNVKKIKHKSDQMNFRTRQTGGEEEELLRIIEDIDDDEDQENKYLEDIYLQDNINNLKIINQTKELLETKLETLNIKNIGILYDETYENVNNNMILSDIYMKYYITEQYIFKDNTIKNVKNKILLGLNLSNKFNGLKILPETQYLWCEYIINDKYDQVMLGQKWIRKNELINIDIIPNDNIIIYEKIRGNLKYVKDNFEFKLKREDDENYILSYYNEFITMNEIFFIDIYNELGLDYNPSLDIKINIYDIYINIYFHFITLERLNQILEFLNKVNTKEKEYNELIFQNLLNNIRLENEIENTVEKVKLTLSEEYNKYFNENYIIHSNIHIYLTIYNLNLYRLFDNFIVNENYPFIHIQTMETEATRKYYAKSEIDKEILEKWFDSSPKGISIKIKYINDKYLTIAMSESGRIEYTITWRETEKATINDIKDTYNYLINLIKKINSENKKMEIVIPSEDDFQYGFINSIMQFTLPEKIQINHNELSNFSRYFFNYISLVIEPKKRITSKHIDNNIYSKYGTYLRYKRVHNYDNLFKIYMKIIYYMNYFNLSEKDLINEIETQFNIIKEDAINMINYVKLKYNKLISKNSRKRKLIKKPKVKLSGVGIDIQGRNIDNYKIRLTGIRSDQQLDDILNFLKILIYLYVQIYIYKNKTYDNIIDTLKVLHKIAKRKNLVSTLMKTDTEENEIKIMKKMDKDRLGYNSTDGSDQYSRLCQNSGNKKRRPTIISENDINKLISEGYKLNPKTNNYEKDISVNIQGKKYKTTIQALKLLSSNNTYNFYTCDPSQNNENIYIGFLTKSYNPNELCMPCCFKKPFINTSNKEKQKFYLNCIGENKILSNLNELVLHDKVYILNNTSRRIMNNKFMLLPKYLDILFNKLWMNTYKSNNHYFYESITGYFFEFTIKENQYSFLSTISNIYNITIEKIIDKIISFLENPKNDKYFIYLNNGDLAYNFNNNKKDFINFIKNADYLEYDIIGELIALPNVITEKGINYFIFNSIDEKKYTHKKQNYFLECLNKENFLDYNDDRDFIFLIKDNQFYSPIYKISKNPKISKKINLEKKFNNNSELLTNVINEIKNYYENSCKINIFNNLFIDKILFAKNLIYHLINNKFVIIIQYIDNLNKCNFIELKNGLLLPTYSSGINYNYLYTYNAPKKNKIFDIKNTITLLNEVNTKLQLNYIPTIVFYNKKKNNMIYITSILLKNNLIIPLINEYINELDIIKMGLNYNYKLSEEDINKKISNNEIIYDNTIKKINEYNYTLEGYNLYRLELSHYLNDNNQKSLNIKNEIINIVRKSTESIIEKKNKLRNILFDIIHKKMITIINNIPELDNYRVNNIRTICSTNNKEQCNTNKYCKWLPTEKICKFQIYEEHLINNVNKIIEEFIEDDIKFKEILEEGDYYVSNIINYLDYVSRDNQKIYKISNFNIKQIMEEIFGKNKIPISKRKKTSLAIIEENEIPLIHMKDYYLQEIIYNNDTIIRAYINVYYWLNNPLYDKDIRNLGYYSSLQTHITNLFKATIIDFIINRLNIIHSNTQNDEINNVLINFFNNDNLNFFESVLNNFSQSTLNSNGYIELLILSYIINIPIIVYNNNFQIKYLFINGMEIKDKNIINEFIKKHNKSYIYLRFDYNNNLDIPTKIHSIYY
uniref:Uncharacterized protein n=1 Tax=viral metagenome TaxID=1070528 RepID=A0A6C0H7V8_9ZZZZ